MTKQEKFDFIDQLTSSVVGKIKSNIDNAPEDWDGHELRQYIADSFAFEVVKMNKSRQKEYENALLVNNL